MTHRSFASAIGIVLILGSVAACTSGSEEAATADAPKTATIAVAQLIEAGKPPVEIGNLIRGISPVMPTFSVSVANVSDAPVKLIKGTVVFFDEDGKCLPDTIAESGYTDLSPIAPGATITLQMMVQNEKASSGKWILKEVIYEQPNPLGAT